MELVEILFLVSIGFLDLYGEFILEFVELCEVVSNFDEICKSWSLMMEIWEEFVFDMF